MSMKSQFQSLVSMFTGPTSLAARDVAHNFSVGQSKSASQKVQAALAKLGLWSMRMPLVKGSSSPKPDAPRPGKHDGY